MEDRARFALAIAAILAATALDAQQSSSSRATDEAETRSMVVRPAQSDAPSPAGSAGVAEVDAGRFRSASARIALLEEFDRAGEYPDDRVVER
jgi:hypothetical protein